MPIGTDAVGRVPTPWNWTPAYVAPEFYNLAMSIAAGYVPGFSGLSRQGVDNPIYVNNQSDPILPVLTRYGYLTEMREVAEPWDTHIRVRNRLTNGGRREHTSFFFGRPSDENQWVTKASGQINIPLFGGNGGLLVASSGSIKCDIYNTGGNGHYVQNVVSLPDDQSWQAITFRHTGGRGDYFQNGVNVGSGDTPTYTSVPDDSGPFSGDMAVGARNSGNEFGQYPAGVICGACYVFDRALSDSEIALISRDPWGVVRHYRDTQALAFRAAAVAAAQSLLLSDTRRRQFIMQH